MKPGMVPEFTGSQPVALVNAQKRTVDMLISYKTGDKLLVSMSPMTNVAIQVLENELDERNINNSEGADKQLRLAIHDVSMTIPYAFVYRCTPSQKAEAGDGYISEHEAINNGNVNSACDGAILRAVAAMSNDDAILYYLKH